MEKIVRRTVAFGAALLFSGLAIQASVRPAVPPAGRNEAWLEDLSPTVVPGYRFLPAAAGSRTSYRMDKSTYDTLTPYGIVAQVYEQGPNRYDAVVIASNKKASFHDPSVCFSAQNWSLRDQRIETLDTKSRGQIPVTVVDLEGPSGKSVAIFLYKGPNGFVGATSRLKWEMFLDQLTKGRQPEAVFYRFIDISKSVSKTRLKEFAARYLDAIDRTSGGVL